MGSSETPANEVESVECLRAFDKSFSPVLNHLMKRVATMEMI